MTPVRSSSPVAPQHKSPIRTPNDPRVDRRCLRPRLRSTLETSENPVKRHERRWVRSLHIHVGVEIVYAAHTQAGVFMLDEQGVCRWAVAHPNKREKVPERIVGAQYVATLDVGVEGALVTFPRVGCPMLFAATDESGRIRLVRTPPLERFEDRRNAPTRQPLASKLDFDVECSRRPTYGGSVDMDERTPIAASIPPESFPVPLLNRQRPSPLPPPPQARIAARIPPVTSLAATSSGLRATRPPSRITLKKLAQP